MIFNLVSNLSEGYDPDLILQYNTSIAVSLKAALIKAGHYVTLVKDHDDEAPTAGYTIVISNWAMNRVRDDPAYLPMLRRATRWKLCLWLDAAFGGMDAQYDTVFTVVPPYDYSGPKFRWAGFAADPDIFKSQQASQPRAFIDSYAYGWHDGKYDYVFDIIKAVTKDMAVSQPVEQYNEGRRIPRARLAEIMSYCHFSVVTQVGNWGLTNIETATCGALLVIHKDMNAEHTWPCELNHALWKSKYELEEILSRPVDVEANRAKALEQNWAQVVARIEGAL